MALGSPEPGSVEPEELPTEGPAEPAREPREVEPGGGDAGKLVEEAPEADDSSATDVPARRPAIATDRPVVQPFDARQPVFPPRPRYTGLGLFLAAGGMAAIGLGQQFFAYNVAIAHEECLANSPTGDDLDPTGTTSVQPGDPALVCAFAPQFVGFLRMSTTFDLALAAGLAGGGAAVRGRLDAYDHFMGHLPRRKTRKLKIAGGTLLGSAVLIWGVTRLVLVLKPSVCETLPCLVAVDGIATDVAAIAAGVGAGTLGYAIAYDKSTKRLDRIRLGVAPQASRTGFGLGVTGSF